MRTMSFALAAISAIFFLVAKAEAAMPFRCQPGAGGICACKGADDCQDMRKSGMCDGAITCKTQGGELICNCTAARSRGGTTARQPPAAGTMQKQ
jgi:hypothetical protein